MRRHLVGTSILLLATALAPRAARADVSLEPDGDRFGTVRADGARIHPGHWWDPYGPNVLKGDRPFVGSNNYLVVSAIVDSLYTGARAGDPKSATQVSTNQFLLSLEYFNGQTVFRPKTVSLRATGIAKSTLDTAGKKGIQGENRVDAFALGETFAEVLVASYNARYYDSSSVRGGVQAFNLDVQGLVLNDAIGGVRSFSEVLDNRYNVNLVYERPLEKSAAAVVEFDKVKALEADVVAGSVTVGDAFVPGFNLIAFGAYDDDRRDPARRLRVGYAGLGSNGHLGRVVTAPAVYLAWGDDEHATSSRILAPMAVLDLSRPSNAWNHRLTMLWAPGDRNPTDGTQTAYDAIADKVAFAGGAGAGVFAGKGFAVPSAGGTSVLFRKGSVIPSLRGGNARPNYTHGGILLGDLGADLALSPRFTATGDLIAFGWDQPKTLGILLGTPAAPHAFAGTEYIAQLKYKPFLNENALIVVDAAALVPGPGLSDLTGSTVTVLTGDARVLLAF